MSAIVKEVYDAFREAGVSEEKSTEAAKAYGLNPHNGWKCSLNDVEREKQVPA